MLRSKVLRLFKVHSLGLCLISFAGYAAAQETESTATTSVVADGAKLELLADTFSFTEGPAADADGNVYFTDQPNDAIYRWNNNGELTKFLQPCGRSNGLYFLPDGTLLACADAENQLWAIKPDTEHQVLVSHFENKLLNGPNDLWVDRDGSIYFTDPYYRRPYWHRGETEQPSQAVYRITPDRTSVARVADQLKQPNGIIGDASKRLLYVADIGDGKTYRYTIADDGSLTDRQLFCKSGSDGMTIDRDGNVYLTGGQGVTVFNSAGEQIDLIKVPERWTANVTFGGPERDTLFITASDSLYSIRVRTRGL